MPVSLLARQEHYTTQSVSKRPNLESPGQSLIRYVYYKNLTLTVKVFLGEKGYTFNSPPILKQA